MGSVSVKLEPGSNVRVEPSVTMGKCTVDLPWSDGADQRLVLTTPAVPLSTAAWPRSTWSRREGDPPVAAPAVVPGVRGTTFSTCLGCPECDSELSGVFESCEFCAFAARRARAATRVPRVAVET